MGLGSAQDEYCPSYEMVMEVGVKTGLPTQENLEREVRSQVWILAEFLHKLDQYFRILTWDLDH